MTRFLERWDTLQAVRRDRSSSSAHVLTKELALNLDCKSNASHGTNHQQEFSAVQALAVTWKVRRQGHVEPIRGSCGQLGELSVGEPDLTQMVQVMHEIIDLSLAGAAGRPYRFGRIDAHGAATSSAARCKPRRHRNAAWIRRLHPLLLGVWRAPVFHFCVGVAVEFGRRNRALALANFSPAIHSPQLPPSTAGCITAKARRVIQLFMNGGASQMDLFDYKPELVRLHGKAFDPGAGIRVEAATSAPGNVMKSPFEFNGMARAAVGSAICCQLGT